MMQIETHAFQQKKILLQCLIATIGIHVAAFFYFYQFPPSLPYSWHQMLAQSLPILKMIPKEEESQLLEEVFDPFPDIATLLIQPYDMVARTTEPEGLPKEEPFQTLRVPVITERNIENLSFSPLAFSPLVFSPLSSTLSLMHNHENLHLALPEALPENYALPIPALPRNLTAQLAAPELLLELELEETLSFGSPPALPEQALATEKKESLSIPQIRIVTGSTQTQTALTLPEIPAPALPLIEDKRAALPLNNRVTTELSPLENYKLPKTKALEFPETYIDAEVRIAKGAKGKGYIFTIGLKPTKNSTMASMQQNYTFLLDRTNSIPKHHFTSFKKATLRALSMLQEGDTFNIVVFDKKKISFSKKPVYYSKDALEDAEHFLNKQQSGGLFAAADLYDLLPKIIPSDVPEDEVNTVILLTDGAADAKGSKQNASLKRLLESCKKKMTLYTAAVSQGNNLKLLDNISSSTGGSLLYSETYAAFPRRLAGLIYKLRAPIAKELSIAAIEQNADSHINLCTPCFSVFHSGQPFEIVGTIDALEDFTLIIEGIHEGEAVRLKKKISFAEAKKDVAFVMKKWDTQQSRIEFEKMLTQPQKPKS